MNRIQHQIDVTLEWITHYARSIEAPLQRINGETIAPSTMPIIFWQSFDIPWLSRDTPMIHGSQQFSYKAPITAGMTLHCELSLSKVEKKASNQGELTLYTHTLVCTCEGNLIVTAETVLIQVGDLDEETHNS